jgi:hypothetical protein
MASWRPSHAVFHGGTDQIRSLFGRRVRTTGPIAGLPMYDPASRHPGEFDLPMGATGLVAHPHPGTWNLLIAFPINAAQVPVSLGVLRFGTFKTVVVNEPTFRQRFEIEVP